MPVAGAALQQHQPIHWLPVTWTVCLMTIALGITSFIAVNVPESYMVRCCRSVITAGQRQCVRAHRLYSSRASKHPCAHLSLQQSSLHTCLLPNCSAAFVTCAASGVNSTNPFPMLAGRAVPRAYGAAVLQGRAAHMGCKDNNLPRPLRDRRRIRMGGAAAAALDRL